MTGCFVINDLILNGNPSEKVAIAYTKHQLVNLIILFKAYFESSILIMSYMYKKHRYAFRTHARDKILLIVFTFISFVIIILNQFLFGYWRFCRNEYEAQCKSDHTCGQYKPKSTFCSKINSWMDNTDYGLTSELYFVMETICVYLLPFWSYIILE